MNNFLKDVRSDISGFVLFARHSYRDLDYEVYVSDFHDPVAVQLSTCFDAQQRRGQLVLHAEGCLAYKNAIKVFDPIRI
mgnify:CR=1 FL=1